MMPAKKVVLWIAALAAAAQVAAASPQAAAGGSDERAVELARSVLDAMGGAEAWQGTRYLRWRFFGGRLHYWDRYGGDVRIESPARTDREGNEQPSFLVLMNVRTEKGRAWEDGKEVVDPAALAEYLDRGRQIWVNDSYWMFMPYKLLDPGVTLRYAGERELPDGRDADVLDMTFGEGVGYTPENRYEVWIARDTGLVEQWSFYAEAAAEKPDFTLPWSDWKQFGRIRLATNHGRGMDWEIAVYDELPRTVFEDPGPVE